MGSVSLAIAVQSSRRAISTIAVLGYFVISLALSEILLETISGDSAGYSPSALADEHPGRRCLLALRRHTRLRLLSRQG